MPVEMALAELDKEAGRKFEPKIIAALRSYLERAVTKGVSHAPPPYNA